jgi:hypothetical protein
MKCSKSKPLVANETELTFTNVKLMFSEVDIFDWKSLTAIKAGAIVPLEPVYYRIDLTAHMDIC